MQNLVYVRIVAYVLSLAAGMIPAAWAGFASFNEAAGTITISIEGAATALVTALIASFTIFKAWGTK
jgi:hypothetical protein